MLKHVRAMPRSKRPPYIKRHKGVYIAIAATRTRRLLTWKYGRLGRFSSKQARGRLGKFDALHLALAHCSKLYTKLLART